MQKKETMLTPPEETLKKTDSVQHIGELSAKKALSRLGAKSISTRKCPIILSPELAVGFYFHHFYPQ